MGVWCVCVCGVREGGCGCVWGVCVRECVCERECVSE